MPSFNNGVTVTFLRRTVSGTDERGDDVYTTTEDDVAGCSVSPGYSSETDQGSIMVQSGITVQAPPDTDSSPVDALRLPDGSEWEVQGDSSQWQSPFTTVKSFLKIKADRTTGGNSAT
jgi:hypothetical protein